VIRSEPSLPETVTKHGDGTLKSYLTFVVEESAAKSASASQQREVIVADHQAVDSFNVVTAQVQFYVRRSGQAGKAGDSISIVQVFGIRKQSHISLDLTRVLTLQDLVDIYYAVRVLHWQRAEGN
jgi:hypothetical protein